jgi:hypothetical protein
MRRRRGVIESPFAQAGFAANTFYVRWRRRFSFLPLTLNRTHRARSEVTLPTSRYQIPRSGLVQLRLCKDLHKRKNWIHLGCEGAGPRIAAIISVIETCRRLRIRPRDYLGAILPGLADFPAKRVAELAPLAWVQTRR